MSDLSKCLLDKPKKTEVAVAVEKDCRPKEKTSAEADPHKKIVEEMNKEEEIAQNKAKASELLNSDIVDGSLCLKYEDGCIVRSVPEKDSGIPKYVSFEEMPLICPVFGCKAFLRLHEFHRHMFRFHRCLEIHVDDPVGYYLDEKISFQIKLDKVDKDFRQTVCHGYFHLFTPKSDVEEVWKTRMPVLVMSKIIDMKELGFETWKNHAVSEFYLMVWFIGIQCSNVPKIQINMSSSLFGTQIAMLRCAQKPMDTINLLTTHSSIFFNKDDVAKIKSENSSVFNVEIEPKLCENYKGFDITKIIL